MTSRIVKAAVVQAAPVVFDRDRTLDKLARLAAEAAGQGAEIVVFPEAFVSAYPKGLDFGARLGSRTPAGRDDFLRYHASSVDIPGPALDRICQAARDAGAYLVVGVIERDGGTLYCTVVFAGPDGRYLGKHRKLMPTALERLVWGFGDGSTLTTVDAPFGRIGSVICWENYMPMLRMAMYAKGVQLYCAPTADSRDTWLPTMQHVAMEGRCFVLSCCQYLTRGDCPADYAVDPGYQGGAGEPSDVLMGGGSCIVSPLGEVLAGPVFGSEAILTAELDMGEIARGKYDFDAVGHYARPDIFRLHVNQSPAPPVVTSEHGPNDPFAEPGG